jgi:hypothetical protein
MQELLTERQAAALLKVSVKSLQGWRSRGGGPPFLKLGRCVRYSVAELDAFLREAVRRSSSDPGPSHKPAYIRIEHLLGKTGRRLNASVQNAPEAASPSVPPRRRRRRLHSAYIKLTLPSQGAKFSHGNAAVDGKRGPVAR